MREPCCWSVTIEHFLDNVVTSTLVFEGAGRVNGVRWRLQRLAAAAQKYARTDRRRFPGAGESRRAHGCARLSYNEQRELAQLPERIQHLEAEQAQLHSLISDPSIFQRNKDQSTAALQRLQVLTTELEAAYSRWDALESSANSTPRI